MSKFFAKYTKERLKSQWGDTSGKFIGYYLCVKLDGVETKYWFAETLSSARKNLDKACDKWLTEKNGWRYSVEYSHGLDVKGYVAWGNMDIDLLD